MLFRSVTYMNRPASPQVDTLEQRARAFGYRHEQLPYCQFFASKRTIRSLRDIVYTEYDLRARLKDHIGDGGTVGSWAAEVGLMIPEGMKPTREAVVQALTRDQLGWHAIRHPSLDRSALEHNAEIVRATGLATATLVDYGRLSHRTMSISVDELIGKVLEPWIVPDASMTWRSDEIVNALRRSTPDGALVPVLLMEESGGPRIRLWDSGTGFVNLFQGRDNNYSPFTKQGYPGDRRVPGIEQEPDTVALQVHRVVRRDDASRQEILALAIYLGSRHIVRKVSL